MPATNLDVLTPDFYDYAWTPPSSVTVNGRFVDLSWPDGRCLQAFDLWLRENAVACGGFDAATREGLIDPADHAASGIVRDAALLPDGAVGVTFTDHPVVIRYHPGWLRHVADGDHRPDRWVPEAEPWTAAELGKPPTHDGPSVLRDEAAFRHWINDLVRWGISRLRSLPDDPSVALRLAERIGPVRSTNFGLIWDVKADVALAGNAATNSTANSGIRLGPHTDLPTRETPPGFQFLHCLTNSARGGLSTMADGAAVVAALEAEHPEHHDALTTLNWVFFNRGPDLDHRWSGPIIDPGRPGAPLTLRAFYPVRAFPDMAASDVPRAYAALQCFSAMAADPRFRIGYPFRSGDLVAFDNRRILHGRDAFETSGRRHLRGIYIDRDEVLSAARVANRRAKEAIPDA